MNLLSVTLIQTPLIWENQVANRDYFSRKINEISGSTNLIILPEMFTTGFSMNAQFLFEENEGQTLQWMISEARKNNSAITGSIIIKDEEKFFNRLYFVFPNGEFKQYDKRHTFTLANEHKIYTAGKEHLIVDYLGWKICPLICYDLRFPVWSRNTFDYDLLIYVANWPMKRIIAWDTLLKARAIENLSYCIGVNRIGTDGNGHEYVGHSAVYDVLGKRISTKEYAMEFVETILLDRSHIIAHREHLQFLTDRDMFSLE